MPVDFKDLNQRADDIYKFYHAHPTSSLEFTQEAAGEYARIPTAPWHPESASLSLNSLLRCGIFRVAQSRAERKLIHRHRFPLQASRGGYVEYTGAELRQNDGNVFMMLLQAELQTPGVAVVRLRRFANQLGWGTSNEAIKNLEDSIIRMSATNVEVNSNAVVGASMRTGKVAFSLVVGYRIEEPGVWIVYLDPRLRGYGKNDYTMVQKAHLRSLPTGAFLASWLLKLLATHREPRPMSFDELHRYCGSSSTAKEFKRLIMAATEKLREIGFLHSYSVKNEQLHVVRALCEESCDTADGEREPEMPTTQAELSREDTEY